MPRGLGTSLSPLRFREGREKREGKELGNAGPRLGAAVAGENRGRDIVRDVECDRRAHNARRVAALQIDHVIVAGRAAADETLEALRAGRLALVRDLGDRKDRVLGFLGQRLAVMEREGMSINVSVSGRGIAARGGNAEDATGNSPRQRGGH